MTRSRPLAVARPPRLGGFAATIWWPTRRGSKALEDDISALSGNVRPSPRRALAIAAKALAEVSGARPGLSELRAALAMMAGRYVVVQNPELRRQAATLAACAQAMEGRQVHVIHLSEQAATVTGTGMERLVERLGLECIVLPESADLDQREAAYRADIVLASANRLTRDLLRDRVLLQGRNRGRRAAVARLGSRNSDNRPIWPTSSSAIVFDADLLFFEPPQPVAVTDERERSKGRLLADQAFSILVGLQRQHHYSIDTSTGRIRLSDVGWARVETYAALFGGAWLDPDWCEKTILAAIAVRDLFQPGSDYALDAGDVQLMRAAGRAQDAPSIPELIAAKESVPVERGELHLADIRRLMQSYDGLGAVGLHLPGIDVELAQAFGLKRMLTKTAKAPSATLTVCPDADAVSEHLATRLAILGPDVTLWTPVPIELSQIGRPDLPVVAGLALFAAPLDHSHVIQVGAAPPHWEARLASLGPALKYEAVVSHADAYFALLPKDDPVRLALASRPTRRNYTAAQVAEAKRAHLQRMATLTSDAFFDRILAFTGDMRW